MRESRKCNCIQMYVEFLCPPNLERVMSYSNREEEGEGFLVTVVQTWG
jgi:hypothetical protein